MPLGAVKADAPKRGTASGKEKTASASRAAAASSKEKAANGLKKSAGIKGFSSNPFQLDHKKNGTKKTKPDLNRAIYGDKQKDVKPLSLGSDKKVTLSGKGASPPPDRMTPDRRVFSGGEHTLSRVDDDPPPEVTLRYSLNKNATTSLVINPQDEASPLPRPAEANRDLNAAGVYVNVDVAPDVKLRVGGEYCTIDDSGAGKSENSHGAAVGLEWSF